MHVMPKQYLGCHIMSFNNKALQRILSQKEHLSRAGFDGRQSEGGLIFGALRMGGVGVSGNDYFILCGWRWLP